MKKSNPTNKLEIWTMVGSLKEQPFHLQYHFKISDLNGIEGRVLISDQDLNLDVTFSMYGDFIQMSGSWNATLSLECQRCLKAFDQALSQSFSLCLVSCEKDLEKVPESFEGMVLDPKELLDIHEFISEEIVLALPIVPRHESIDCNPILSQLHESNVAEAPENPFKILAKLTKPTS